MYKTLLCLRYLRTRYIALASVISVMLGVATMIVVNSVMSGFTHETQERIKGTYADLILESRNTLGRPNAAWHIEQIRKNCDDVVEGATPILYVPGMLTFRVGENTYTRQVEIFGIDPQTQGSVSDFSKYLQHPENRRQMSFELRDGGYDTRDHQSGPEVPERPQMAAAGKAHRKAVLEARAEYERMTRPSAGAPRAAVEDPFPAPAAKTPPPARGAAPDDPFAGRPSLAATTAKRDAAQNTGIVLGIVQASWRDAKGQDHFAILPGDDVILTTVNGSVEHPQFVNDSFTLVDFYESKMSEYDAKMVFVPIEALQRMRGMVDPTTGAGLFNAIQIKLRPGTDPETARERIQALFPRELYAVQTWREKQGALLSAIEVETAILNVLLFLIIAVSGFGILAIFFMIVVEKTRDIGILKSLGASGGGIMGIFLGYGLTLGLVGCGAGLGMGLLFVKYINQIADGLAAVTGRKVFDPTVYNFYSIPTLVEPWTLGWIVAGALAIAVLASVLPALRAALLHPVEALRYE